MISSNKLDELLKYEVSASNDIKAIVVVSFDGGVFSLGMNEEYTNLSQVNHISAVLMSSLNEYNSTGQNYKDLYLETKKGKFIIGNTSYKNLSLIIWFDEKTSIGKVHLKFMHINNALSG